MRQRGMRAQEDHVQRGSRQRGKFRPINSRNGGEEAGGGGGGDGKSGP